MRWRHADFRIITTRGRKERTRRTWMAMAGVKTLDLLVGVVLVLQCARNVHAEIINRNGKKSQLQHRPRCACRELQGATVAPLSVTGGIRHENKLQMPPYPPHKTETRMEPDYALKSRSACDAYMTVIPFYSNHIFTSCFSSFHPIYVKSRDCAVHLGRRLPAEPLFALAAHLCTVTGGQLPV